MSAQPKGPGFTAALMFLWLVSVALGVVGVAGWLWGEGPLAQKVAFAFLAAAAAGVVPTVIASVGRSWHSIAAIPCALGFMAWGAYSLHHANEALVEAPRLSGWMVEADRDLADAKVRETAARKALADLPALKLDPTMPMGRVKAQQAAWKDQRDTLAAVVETAKSETLAATKARDERARAYHPLVPEKAMIIGCALLDLLLACGFFAIEGTRHAERRRLKREAEAQKVQASDGALAASVRPYRESLQSQAAAINMVADMLRKAA